MAIKTCPTAKEKSRPKAAWLVSGWFDKGGEMLFEDSAKRIARGRMLELIGQRPESSPFFDAAGGSLGVEPGLKDLQCAADA